MKSVKIKDVKEFEVVDIDEPKDNGEKVIIDIKRCGICGSDIHYWDVGFKGLVMGHEFCGEVVSPGSRSDLKVGDKVSALPISPCCACEACESGNHQYCAHTWDEAVGLSLNNPGGLTSRIAVRPDMVMKVPDHVSFDEGAMIEPTSVGLHAIHLADIKVGDKVLVIGGGIIGLMSAMFAKKEGASIVDLTETNPARGEKSVSLGVADNWYNALEENIVEKLKEKTNGGYDMVIECVGNAPAVNSAISYVKNGGKIILVGVSIVPVEINTMSAVTKELTIKGAIGYTKDEFATSIELIANKQVDVLKFVDDIVPLSRVQESYERLTSGKDSAVKILVDPTKE